jgi:hypothetical protein
VTTRSWRKRKRLDFPAKYPFPLLFLLVLFLSLCFGVVQAAGPDEGLRQGAQKFINLVEAKDSLGLLNLFSEQGTSFVSGTYALTKVEFSQSEIRKNFEAKTDVYCLFFNSQCLRDADSRERVRLNKPPLKIALRSISDLLAAADEKKFVTYDISSKNGKVTLLLSARTPETARLGEDALNFYFRQENGEWKLRNVEFQ